MSNYLKVPVTGVCTGGHRWQSQVVWLLAVSEMIRWDLVTIRKSLMPCVWSS
jgi:hypothetical protein